MMVKIITENHEKKYGLVVIGASVGGVKALKILFGGLRPDFALPIVVVLHRGMETRGLAAALQPASPLPVTEAEDKDPIRGTRVYLAPTDYHLLIDDNRLALSTEGPVNHARPSIDVLFESAAEAYGDRVIGILLTGGNQDGAVGLAWIKEKGGLVIVQDPLDAENGTMPAAALAVLPAVDHVLPLGEIGPFLVGLVHGSGWPDVGNGGVTE